MSAWKTNRILLFKIAIVSLFVLFVALQGNKLFTLDEMDFPTVSKATSHTLRPVWYKGEVTSQQSGLFHPPLYIYSLASFIRAFGFSEMTVRLFGLVCTLITAYLLINILRLFNFKNRWGEVLLLALFLLNPYTIACATVPDIDTTILPITMLTFIYLTLRYYWQKNLSLKYETALLSGVFAINLWSKLTTPLMLPFFLFALLLICGSSFRNSLIKTLKISLIGAAAFLITYFVYTKLVSLPMSYTFRFLIESFTKGTAGHQPIFDKIINNVGYFKSQIYWLTVPFTFVYLISLAGIVINRVTDRQSNIIRLLAIFGLAIFVFYTCLISPFGGFFKYPFPVFGLMVMTIVIYFQNGLSKIKVNGLLGGLFALLAFVIETHYFRDTVFKDRAIFRGFILLILAAFLFYGLLYHKRTLKYSQLALVYILFIVVGFQLGISRVQAVATYPTKYLYGQQGMSDAINYLKLNTKRDEIIWSMKDVGFYVNDKYYESYPFYFDNSLQPQLVKMLQDGKIRYYVATTGIGEDRIDYYKDIANILNSNATRVASFGNFVIYRSNYANPN